MGKDSRPTGRKDGRRAGTLSSEAWERAALEALARGGTEAVAVEPLARRLGVTKGSFYWHFRNREALLRAALRRWEREGTDQVLESVLRLPDARARLERLVSGAYLDPRYRRFEAGILAASHDPLVRPVVRRVQRRRLRSTEAFYRELGLSPEDARNATIHGYSSFLGLGALERQTGRSVLTPAETERYTRYLISRLLTRA